MVNNALSPAENDYELEGMIHDILSYLSAEVNEKEKNINIQILNSSSKLVLTAAYVIIRISSFLLVVTVIV